MSNITTQLEFCEAYREKRGGEEGIKLAKMGGYDTAPACTPWQPGSGAPYANPKNDEWFEMNPVGLKASQHKDKSGKKDVVRGCVIHVDVDAEKYVVPQGETVADHQERADAHYAAERERITAHTSTETAHGKSVTMSRALTLSSTRASRPGTFNSSGLSSRSSSRTMPAGFTSRDTITALASRWAVTPA
jgi:hypothetical protein